MIRETLAKLSQKQSLSEKEAYDCMIEILEGKALPTQVAAYLAFLNLEFETPAEVVGSVKAMRDKMVRLNAEGLDAIDVCGTGGDHKGTFNISTGASLVLAGGGVKVAKHGNRAASSQCGSAEVLEALGVKIAAAVPVLEKCLREAGMAFLFAPHFHPAMKNVGPIRKELGIRTIFNVLGPMSNPASVKRQVIGVFDAERARLIGEALVEAGMERVLTLHSKDGLDEISNADETFIWELKKDEKGTVQRTTGVLDPEVFGFKRRSLNEIKGSDAASNAQILLGILKGEKGAHREAVVMNAAVGFYVAGKCDAIPDGRPLAENSIDSGSAIKVLEKLRKVSNE
jgi:anthranilate phosphoribosyltransferase